MARRSKAPEGLDRKTFVRLGTTRRVGARKVVLVPGAQVPVMSLTLPSKLKGAAREQVARRQLADTTGQDAKTLDVRPFHAPRQSGEWSRVLMADSDQMADWRKRAPRVKAILPDFLALPAAEGLWCILREGDSVLVRLGPDDGYTTDLALAPAAFAQALAAVQAPDAPNRPRAILRLGSDPLEDLVALAAHQNLPVETRARALKAHKIAPPKVLGHGELAFDLRRDPRTTRTRLRNRVLPWRWPVLAGLLAAGLWSGASVLEIDRLDAQRRELSAATTALVRQYFVPQGPILDVRVQITRALGQTGTAADAPQNGSDTAQNPDRPSPGDAAGPPPDALDVLSVAADLIVAQRARADVITYAPSEGLRLGVYVANFAALDELVQALANAGLTVTISRSRATDNEVEAQLTLTLNGEAGE